MKPWVAIPLTGKLGRGMFAMVDEDDLHLVEGRRWHLNYPYAMSSLKLPDGRRSARGMHRFILDAQPGQSVDHVNANGLDNRRCNLRIATNGQNTANARAKHNGYRGISCYGIKWVAACSHGSRRLVGEAANAEEAARLYDQFARELHGEFARLNFPGEGERGLQDLGSPWNAAEQRARGQAA